ncbi:uncharacterized protein LOC133531302 [Cydia pomonella]|uniref:uncharacterized protein LOC133531302 n=1 Tax=Cydia pomonella TaxID=82600 RepID=UPI002ADE020A|nr:uncharacterized protein LOC133531302 [Cydia pomonella]
MWDSTAPPESPEHTPLTEPTAQAQCRQPPRPHAASRSRKYLRAVIEHGPAGVAGAHAADRADRAGAVPPAPAPARGQPQPQSTAPPESPEHTPLTEPTAQAQCRQPPRPHAASRSRKYLRAVIEHGPAGVAGAHAADRADRAGAVPPAPAPARGQPQPQSTAPPESPEHTPLTEPTAQAQCRQPPRPHAASRSRKYLRAVIEHGPAGVAGAHAADRADRAGAVPPAPAPARGQPQLQVPACRYRARPRRSRRSTRR